MKYLKIIIRAIEMVILFAISAVIVALIIKSGGDSKTLQDDTSMLIIGIAFLFPYCLLALPLGICLVISFFNSFRLKTIRRKIVLSAHIINICALPLAMLVLPTPEEPTAKMMADNYMMHQKEFAQLKNTLDSFLVDKEGIECYLDKDNKDFESFSIGTKNSGWVNIDKNEIKDIENSEINISPNELKRIVDAMKAANIIGIDFYNDQSYSLLYCRWGISEYRYQFFTSKDKAYRDSMIWRETKNHILFNDTIMLSRSGVYPGGGIFCDYKEFCAAKKAKEIVILGK